MASQATAEYTKSPIYSFSSLKSSQREVKDRSKREVVHITENGNAAYVFCSEEVFEREKADAVATAIRDREVAQLILQGRKDVAFGRCVEGLGAAKERMHAIWGRND